MAGSDCISDADLRAFLLGDLSEPAARGVACHLEACPECEAAARRLDGLTDSVVRGLRRAVRPDRDDSA